MDLPTGFSWAENVELGSPEVYRLSKLSWPRFLLEESDLPDPILKFQLSVDEFRERFKVFGIRQHSTGLLVAFIQAVLVEIDPSARTLPEMGWRFSIQNASQNTAKNAVSLIEASIDPDFRGQGLSTLLIERVKKFTREKGYSQLIAPVRPVGKARFAQESMEDYLARERDPWLRVHLESGAEIVNVCHDSVRVRATLAKWREWTGLPFSEGDSVIVDGALMPIQSSGDIGVYQEPNVWVRYR